ncbi:unnamed protein product [Lupinus luteus]|uniref:X8 domain-containing protein n=1 Tax=Lupinus luteus TaxID=3873 RepID=A0AAV1Y4Z5_LUPLU
MPITSSFVFSIYFPILPLLLILTLSPFCGGHSGGVPPHELWCVAKNNAEDAPLQDALNWACGPGKVDCGPIQEGGPCYDANNVQNTASYAFNDYFRKHGLANDDCNFNNNAAITTLNPSHDNCKFPSSVAAVSNGSFSGSAVPMAGLGPSDNMNENGCSEVSWSWWFWPMSMVHLLLMFSVSGVVYG